MRFAPTGTNGRAGIFGALPTGGSAGAAVAILTDPLAFRVAFSAVVARTFARFDTFSASVRLDDVTFAALAARVTRSSGRRLLDRHSSAHGAAGELHFRFARGEFAVVGGSALGQHRGSLVGHGRLLLRRGRATGPAGRDAGAQLGGSGAGPELLIAGRELCAAFVKARAAADGNALAVMKNLAFGAIASVDAFWPAASIFEEGQIGARPGATVAAHLVRLPAVAVNSALPDVRDPIDDSAAVGAFFGVGGDGGAKALGGIDSFAGADVVEAVGVELIRADQVMTRLEKSVADLGARRLGPRLVLRIGIARMRRRLGCGRIRASLSSLPGVGKSAGGRLNVTLASGQIVPLVSVERSAKTLGGSE